MPYQDSPRDPAERIGSVPPRELRAFFSAHRQTSRRLSSGEFLQVPLFFWGDGVLGLNGFVPLAIAIPFLRRLGKKPLVLPGPAGPAALAGIMSPSYSGSTAGPYRSFFFGLFVDDPGWSPGRPAPGFQFIQFYDSTRLSTTAGELWGLGKIHAQVTSEYGRTQRKAAVEFESRTMVSLTWRFDDAQPRAVASEKRFHNFPECGAEGARILVVGSDATAPFRPNVDEYFFDPRSKLGRTLEEMRFSPRFWSFAGDVHGVYFLPE